MVGGGGEWEAAGRPPGGLREAPGSPGEAPRKPRRAPGGFRAAPGEAQEGPSDSPRRVPKKAPGGASGEPQESFRRAPEGPKSAAPNPMFLRLFGVRSGRAGSGRVTINFRVLSGQNF